MDKEHDMVNIDVEDDHDSNSVELSILARGTKRSGEGGETSGSKSKAHPPKRRKKSIVWQYFEELTKKKNDVQQAKCKYCGLCLNSDSKNGTGNMKRHIEKCLKSQSKDIHQTWIGASGRVCKFNQQRFRDLLIHAIIKHDLPFSFVEYDGIRELLTFLHPEVKHITRNTAKMDVLKLHCIEARKISHMLRECPGRICLTSDLWTSIATDGYLCLTAHFIDNNWKLQKRILNFSYMPPPHNGISLFEKIYKLLCNWGIERKVFSLTLDNASANDLAVDLLKSQLCLQDALLYDGSCFHIRCCAHILNLIVQEGLKEIDMTVDKIRECVKYVKGSQVRKQKFLDCVAHVSLDNKKSLKQDVPTRWNSTYLMLECSIYYRRAFLHLQLSDSNFKHCPSLEEWVKVEKLCSFLRVFYRVNCILSGSNYPTSNLCFPEVFLVQLTLQTEMKNSDSFLYKMAKQMYVKFEKYWSTYSSILAMAVVFDARYKLQFVEFSYKKLYGEYSQEYTAVRQKLFALFDEYMKLSSSFTNSSTQGESSSQLCYGDHTDESFDILKEFDTFDNQCVASGGRKSQLELYLDEPKLDRQKKLDVLSYWEARKYYYPDLAKMARDILSIPITTVASGAAFSTGGRVLDQYRSSLTCEVVESLICTRDWLFGHGASVQVNLDELTHDIMNLNINGAPT